MKTNSRIPFLSFVTLSACALALPVTGCASESTPAGDGDGSSGGDGGGSGGSGVMDGASGGAILGAGGLTDSGVGGSSVASGGAPTGAGGSSVGDPSCEDAGLVWKTARKTHYTSYPDPGSEECVKYNGCMWAGYFYGCEDQQTEQWVESHDIAAVFPADGLMHHRLCIRSGDKTMIVNVVDTCADSDCDGCCTANKADNDALVDLEQATNARWGLGDGTIEWADLGPNPSPICD